MSLVGQLLVQLSEAMEFDEVVAVCCGIGTLLMARQEERWRDVGGLGVEKIYGYPLKVLPGLPDGVWVLSTQPRVATVLNAAVVDAYQRGLPVSYNELREAFGLMPSTFDQMSVQESKE